MTEQNHAKAIKGDDLCEGARRFLQALADGTACQHATYDRAALKDLRIVEVAEGRILCEVPVSEQHQNRYRTLHGGATGVLWVMGEARAVVDCGWYCGCAKGSTRSRNGTEPNVRASTLHGYLTPMVRITIAVA